MKSVPFPLRIASGVVAVIAIIWLSHSLGGASVFLAVVIWVIVGLGILHASGGMSWVDRHPMISRLLQSYAPRSPGVRSVGSRTEPADHTHTGASSTEVRPEIPDISQFAGIDDVRSEIDVLVQSRTTLTNTVSPATIVFLVGPRGTGKTSVALNMAADLHETNIVKSHRIVVLSGPELPGLSDSFGPDSETLSALSGRIQQALDGVLLVDDIDHLFSLSASASQEIGSRILNVARRFPGRLLVICTGSADAFVRLDPGRRWITQLNVRRLDVPGLPDQALERIFVNLLASRSLQLAPDAMRPFALRIRELRQEGGDDFDNAHAVRRFADAVLHDHSVRMRQTPQASDAQRAVIAAEDVRNALTAI